MAGNGRGEIMVRGYGMVASEVDDAGRCTVNLPFWAGRDVAVVLLDHRAAPGDGEAVGGDRPVRSLPSPPEPSGSDDGVYHMWTAEERAYLISVYGLKTAAVIARELKLSGPPAVYAQVKALKEAGLMGLTCGDCEEAEKEPGETTYCSLEQGIVRKDRPMCYEQILSCLREAGQ